jgi:hypothetical protein
MRWFAAAAGLALATGCASSVPNVEDQPLFAAGWSGPPPHVAVQVTGTGGPTEQQRCVDAVKGAGAVVDAAAPVQALVTLEPGASRLQVTSTRRGLVRDEPRPLWTVERLCKDALLAMVRTIREESPGAGSARSSAAGGPETGMSQQRLSAEPGARPDGPPPLANTSGGTYRGPVQDP